MAQFLLSGSSGQRLRELLAEAQAAKAAPMGAAAGAAGKSRVLEVPAMELLDSLPAAYELLGQSHKDFMEVLSAAAQAATVQATGLEGQDGGALRVRLVDVPAGDFAIDSVSQLRTADQGRLVRFVGTLTRAGAVKVVQEWREFRCEKCQHCFTCRASPASAYDFEMPRECMSGRTQSKWDPRNKRPMTQRCHSRDFQPLPAAERCMTDFQEVRVQDQIRALDAGVVPQSIAVILFGDLVGRVTPGDSVSVEGVVLQRWRPTWQGKRAEVELIVEATNVERLSANSVAAMHGVRPQAAQLGPAGLHEEFTRLWLQHQADPWVARAALLHATAPWLSGLPVVKLALLLTLIGGIPGRQRHEGRGGGLFLPGAAGMSQEEVRWGRFMAELDEGGGSCDGGAGAGGGAAGWVDPAAAAGVAGPGSGRPGVPGSDGKGREPEHFRVTPHLLLLGDPGTGKSQLLLAAQELAGRSVRTSGLGCTNAGLTCAAVREGPDFVLEAGALVLADGGVCCIDEFSTIRSHDRAAVHEAMEQQTVSVAKGGMVCRLRSRCSVVAAQNCRGNAGARARGRGAAYDRGSSIAVNSGLPPPILSRFDLVVVFSETGKGRAVEEEKADLIVAAGDQRTAVAAAAAPPDEGGVAATWGHDQLREYIAWARENLLDGEEADPRALEVIEGYFHKLRASAAQGGGMASGGVTVRSLESLLRLSQAHARLMYHRHVQLEDAVAVVVLHRAALQDHVVGADLPGDAENLEPRLRGDPLGETPACEVSLSFSGLRLHHGSDIPDWPSYQRLEACVLWSLQKRKMPDGSLADLHGGEPLPLPWAPAGGGSQGAEPVPIADKWPASAGSQGATASQPDSCSQQPPAKRGRCLGWRVR